MFLEEKYLLEILLNPGLNLTIFRETGPKFLLTGFTVLSLCRATKVPCSAFDAKQSCITSDEGKDRLYILKSYAWKRHKSN